MSKTLSLLLASAALSAVVGVPAWSAMHTPTRTEAVTPLAAVLGDAGAANLLVLVDDDDDENEDEDERGASDDDHEDDDDDDDDGASYGNSAAKQAAPAGSVPPPQNGLFGTGVPQVKVK